MSVVGPGHEPFAAISPRAGRALLAGAALLLAASGAAAGEALPVPLPGQVLETLARHRLPADSLSVYVQGVDAEGPLLAHLADRARVPASLMKLVTALAGLERLGPNFRWTTRVYAGGAIEAGRLDGDLYLEGGGDPWLVTERFWRLLQRIRERGVIDVGGDVVIDDTWFDGPAGDPGAFDGKPYRTYNALPAATLLNFNATVFHLWPEPRRGRVRVTLDPPSTTLRVDNRIALSGAPCPGGHPVLDLRVVPASGTAALRLSGAYPAACGPFSLSRSITDSALHVLGAFEALWRGMGGGIGGSLRRGRVPEQARELVRWPSEPLAQVVRGMNKFSNNVMSRQLLLTLGAEAEGGRATVQNGRAVVARWLAERGFAPRDIVVDNGSGLSREARASARALARLLLMAWHSPVMPEFVSSLPIAAVDGTLGRRFRGSRLAGRMHLKTGLLDHVRSAAGYVLDASGRRYVVVMLHNHENVHRGPGTRVQDALLEWLIAR